jgi:hypothetical protein
MVPLSSLGPRGVSFGHIGWRPLLRRQRIVTMLIAVLWSNAACAELTGNDWLDACNNAESTPKYAMCVGYLSGTLDGIRLMQKATGTIILCEPPQGITLAQWVAIIRKYLNDHPEQLHYMAASIIPGIVKQAFPCQ